MHASRSYLPFVQVYCAALSHLQPRRFFVVAFFVAPLLAAVLGFS